jgi:hypothetical protein
MEIIFDTSRLPSLYQFKKDVIQLCIDFLKDVIKSSSRPKAKCNQKLKEIETDLYDIFCRWNFNAIEHHEFDVNTFLPTNQFINLEDLAYYARRFNIELNESIVTFPFDQFEKIRQSAIHYTLKNTPIRPIVCSQIQTERLTSMYIGSDIDNDTTKLLSRYYYLGGLNNSLSTPPQVLSLYPSHELFGTPFNTCCTNYCSPFADERVFKSSGSFFEFTDFRDDRVYFANPPFDDQICTKMSIRLLEQLAIRKFSLVVIIPVWDDKQQEKYGLKNFGLPFKSYNDLVQSPYFISEEYLPRDKFPFFNYFYNKYVYISNTHVINLGLPVDIKALIKVWESVKK